ncbi:LytTr DNA-binding domain-containing protein [Spirosomataceae bacterium TFI 002]|nr:LytTr DNA-binding domain-containing protein [Spirosomataceae bacterium TFI 002]
MKTPKILKGILKAQVSHLEASSNYTILNFTDGKQLISGYCLKFFEEHFNSGSFIRIDRANIVNKAFISKVSNDGYIHLKNETKLLIPRRRKALLISQNPNLFDYYMIA